jgi:DNA-binding NtrC family response regulator
MVSNQQTIVVIDEDNAYLMMMQDTLTDAGYQNVICLPPLDAADVLATVSPSLILYDMHCRQSITDVQLLKQFRVNPKTMDATLIVCTTNIVWATHQLAEIDERPRVLIVKPFRLETLLGAVQGCIGPPGSVTAAPRLIERYV